MEFYSSISEYYSDIFPFNPDQVKFIKQSFPNLKQNTLLDIGCATGTLTCKIAPLCKSITGIDLDYEMIKKAGKEAKHNVNTDFITLNMMHITTQFGVYAFDGILCFGNTLVHLVSPQQILNCLSNCKAVLKKDGKLLFQIINYDRILDKGIKQLPTIENDTIQFKRNYRWKDSPSTISFNTTLHLKQKDVSLNNSIQLYPIRQKELENLLYKSGFNNVQFYGNLNRTSLTSESYALVVEAS